MHPVRQNAPRSNLGLIPATESFRSHYTPMPYSKSQYDVFFRRAHFIVVCALQQFKKTENVREKEKLQNSGLGEHTTSQIVCAYWKHATLCFRLVPFYFRCEQTNPRSRTEQLVRSSMSSVVESTTRSAEGEIAGYRVNIEAKVLFLSLRRNDHGHFVRISNVSASSSQGRLVISASGLPDLQRAISNIYEQERALSTEPDEWWRARKYASSRSPIYSEKFGCGTRRFFLDLMINERGLYCKLSSLEPNNKRISILFPASGLIAMVEAVESIQSRLLADPKDDDAYAIKSSDCDRVVHEFSVRGKRYAIESTMKNREPSVRISDFSTNDAVSFPFVGLKRVIDILKGLEGTAEIFGNGLFETRSSQEGTVRSDDEDVDGHTAAFIEE